MRIREASAADSPAIAKVHVASWRSTYRGIISDEVLAGLSYPDRERMWQDSLTTHRSSNFIYVVEADDGPIVGFVAAGKERTGRADFPGEIYAIYLLKDYHGRGWGRQLFLAAAERLGLEGFTGLMLWVLADNPTRGFYETLGGRLLGEQQIQIGSDSLAEVAYGWEKPPEPLDR
jgi:ribosomal protein S18 acetylase RimI-like enzyme